MEVQPAWWAVALTENVAAHLFATYLGNRKLVLWRDAAGQVRALEDRCPHRGVPLSAGHVAADGRIACRDHGWRFDGATGRLTHVPGAQPGQHFPLALAATAIPAAESGGFIWATSTAAAPIEAAILPLSGMARVTLGHADYVTAMLDDPGALIAIRHIRFGAEPLAEPRHEDGAIVIDRAAHSLWPHLRRLVLRARTALPTGDTSFTLQAGGRTLLAARLAPTPAPRGTTAVFWRASPGTLGLRFASPGTLGLRFAPRRVIDPARLVALESATLPAPPLF